MYIKTTYTMRANNTIYFAVRASKSRNNGTSPIQVQLTKDKQRVSFSTGRSVKVSDWDQTHQRVRGRSEESMELNHFLEATKARLNYLEGVLIDRGLGATPQMLRDAYLDKLDCLKDWTLMTLIENHLDELRGKIGKSIAKRTVKNYEYGARFIRDYMRSQYGREDMSIKEVRIGFISGFHSWLLSKRQMQQNSTTKYLKFLQKIMNLAVMNGYISYNSLSMYKVVREPVTPDYLDEEELQRIIEFDSPIERLVITRDMFLFGCFTGLSYIDIKTLTNEHFETDKDGRRWIKKKRVKTNVLSRIPVLPMAQSILDKYSGGKVLLPLQDCTDVNRNIKGITKLCGIDKRVTFHTSRHTFATTVTLANDVPLEIVSQMMGHTNTRMTSHYAKVIDKSIGCQMDTLVDRFVAASRKVS